MKLKLKTQAKKFVTLGIAAMMVCGLVSGCSTDSSSVAATVNGEPVYEKDVTAYIQINRAMYGLTDDTQWASYLSQSGMTTESFRETIIKQQAREVLVAKDAQEAGITVDESELDSQMEKLKSSYNSQSSSSSSALTTSGWASFLKSANVSESDVRNLMKTSLLDQAVAEKKLNVTPSDEDVQTALNESLPTYNGAKKSSHILFDTDQKDTAEEVLQKLKDGADFAELAKEYSKDTGSAEEGGNVGWDKATSFVTEYQTALDALNKGEMTQELVESTYGYHIILCTDTFSYPEGTTPSKDQIPTDIYDTIYDSVKSEDEQTKFQEYAEGLMANADLQINEMPKNLPYAVSSSSTSSSSSTTGTSSSSTSTGTSSSSSTDSSSTSSSSSAE